MNNVVPDLGALLYDSFMRFWDRPALWLNGQLISYGKIFGDAEKLSETIVKSTNPGDPIGLLAQRSYPAFTGVLASVLSGRPYVPINMKFPLERQISIASIAGCSIIISDERSRRRSGEVVGTLGSSARDISIQMADTSARVPEVRNELFTGTRSDIAYIMFTSGTTGIPKGVAIRRENISSYLEAIARIAPIDPGTRCTQLFDLSFDLSVHDIFQTWVSGGCLYVMGDEDALDPVGFARRHALQAWFSVPSVVALARRLERLRPNALPDLRLSLFCGEPLPVSLANAWSDAAPNSRIWNLYGPTEATIAITAKEYESSDRIGDQPATVSLGSAFHNSAAIVVDAERKLAATGELWLGGAQISSGYINNDLQNREKFVHHQFPGHAYERWYRTGDLVRYDACHGLMFEGRLDDQAKIQGYRVELSEIEEVMRKVAATAEVAAVLWPLSDSGAEGVVGFLCSPAGTEREIVAGCRSLLPTYAAPRKVIFIETLPLNANGKVDRNALRERYLSGKNGVPA